MLGFWFLICLSFLIANINILIDESYEVVYKYLNQVQQIQYLSCVNLSEILINKTRIKLNKIENDSDSSIRYLLINKNNYNELILNKTIDKILNQIRSKNYLINQNRFCFVFNNRNDFESFSYSLVNYEIKPNYFIFNNKTFSFLKFKIKEFRKNMPLYFDQITIQHKEYPYSSCSKDYSNFKCLNDKIKQKQRLSKYYYDSSDNGSIEINYQIDKKIIDNEIEIIKQCNQIDCEINLYTKKDQSNSIKLKSSLCISKLDFYLQLIGLIVLFLNIPIYELIIKIIYSIDFKLVNKILKKLKIRIIKIKFKKLNYLIISILVICLLILFSRSIYYFIGERDYPSIKSISYNLIKSEFPVAICIKIEMIKGENYSIFSKSLLDLEKETNNGLNIIIKDIYLEFLNKKIPTKWHLKSELVLFYLNRRCFQLTVILNEPKYQSIFSITKLIIEFNKDKNGTIYILNDNEIFNSKSCHYYLAVNFRKNIFQRSKSNKIKKCKDFNLIDDNCISKWNCIDQCKNREIYNQFKNFTADSFTKLLINKNYFTDKEWSNLFILKDSHHNEIIEKIKKCEDKYSELELCIDVKFEKQSRKNYNYKLTNNVEIDLNYDVIYNKEDEPSIFKLLLDLLNIQINLFGFNFFKFSFMILSLFKLNLKLIKILKLLIYLVCLVGFSYHLWSIYNEIINIEIIYSEHYEIINSIQMPVLIFCFDFNRTKLINQNYKLTYEYLDKITSDKLIEDKIFSKIEYLSNENKWIKLDNETNYQDSNLEIRIFYYLERKCFKIIQNIDYNKNQFYFVDKMNSNADLVLKIFFNRFYLDRVIFYFFTKKKNKFHFSKIHQINLKGIFNTQLFEIKHEVIERDEFELIKNPFSLSDNQNDLDQLFNELINYFDTKLNMVSFVLPFEKTNLNALKELNDNLFIQLYNQKQDQTNNFRQYSINHLEIIRGEDLKIKIDKNLNSVPDFKFNLSFYKKIIVVSNKLSLIKLIINLLNVLSFWFNLGILDLHFFFCKIKLLSIKMYKLLIKIKTKLRFILFWD